MRTLYVTDDEPVAIRVMQRGLEREGFVVETFHNGRDVLERIHDVAPDGLISDIQMPVMDGKELCERIDVEFPNRRFPIFLITSLTDTSHRHWSRRIDRLTFLEKPVSIKRLIDLLNVAIAKKADG